MLWCHGCGGVCVLWCHGCGGVFVLCCHGCGGVFVLICDGCGDLNQLPPDQFVTPHTGSDQSVITIIKTSSTGLSGEKTIYKLLLQSYKHLRLRKKRKHNSGKQPTVDCSLEPIHRSGVKHSVGKVIPQSNLSWQERPSKLGRSIP